MGPSCSSSSLACPLSTLTRLRWEALPLPTPHVPSHVSAPVCALCSPLQASLQTGGRKQDPYACLRRMSSSAGKSAISACHDQSAGKISSGVHWAAQDIFDNILERRIHWPDDISPECRDLIDRLLCLDPDARLGSRGAGEVSKAPPLLSSPLRTCMCAPLRASHTITIMHIPSGLVPSHNSLRSSYRQLKLPRRRVYRPDTVSCLSAATRCTESRSSVAWSGVMDAC